MGAGSVPPRWAWRLADALLVWTAATIPLSVSGMEIGVAGLAILAAVGVGRGWAIATRTALDGALAIFVGTLALSTFASGDPWSATEWSRRWVAVTFVGVAWWSRDDAGAARFARALVAAGAVAGAYGILQHYTGVDWYRDLVGRASVVRPREASQTAYAVVGFFRNYVTYGNVMLFPFAWALAFAARGRPLGVVAALTLGPAIVFSTARGAWLGGLAVGATLLLVGIGRRAMVGGAAVILLAVVALASSPYLRGHAAGMFATSGPNAFRLAIYRANLDIVHEHPVLGLGFGRYRRAARPYYAPYPLADRRSHAHSNPLQFAAEAGLLGLGAFVFLFAQAIRVGWRRARAATDPDAWAVAAGALAAIAGFLVAGLTQYNFGDNEVAIAMWATLALLTRRTAT